MLNLALIFPNPHKFIGIGFLLFASSLWGNEINYRLTCEPEENFCASYMLPEAPQGEEKKQIVESLRQSLALQIQSDCKVESRYFKQENTVNQEQDGTFQEQYTKESRCVSNLDLKSIQLMEYSTPKGYRMVVFVTGADLQKDAHNIYNKLKNIMPELAATKGVLAQDLGLYAKVFGLSIQTPYTLEYRENGMNIANLKEWSHVRLRKILQEAEIRFEKIELHPLNANEYELSLSVWHQGKPLKGLLAQVEGKEYSLADGKLKVPLRTVPTRVKETLAMQLAVKDLAKIDVNLADWVSRSAEYNWQNFIQPAFRFERKAPGLFKFYPEVKHLSVQSIQWDFGDGQISNEVEPMHLFPDTGQVYQTRLTINESLVLEASISGISGKAILIGDIKGVSDSSPQVDPTYFTKTSVPTNRDPIISEKNLPLEIQALCEQRSLSEFSEKLQALRKQYVVKVYQKPSTTERAGLYRAFFNTEGQLLAFLSPRIYDHKDLLSGKGYEEVKGNLKGVKGSFVWFAYIK